MEQGIGGKIKIEVNGGLTGYAVATELTRGV